MATAALPKWRGAPEKKSEHLKFLEIVAEFHEDPSSEKRENIFAELQCRSLKYGLPIVVKDIWHLMPSEVQKIIENYFNYRDDLFIGKIKKNNSEELKKVVSLEILSFLLSHIYDKELCNVAESSIAKRARKRLEDEKITICRFIENFEKLDYHEKGIVMEKVIKLVSLSFLTLAQ